MKSLAFSRTRSRNKSVKRKSFAHYEAPPAYRKVHFRAAKFHPRRLPVKKLEVSEIPETVGRNVQPTKINRQPKRRPLIIRQIVGQSMLPNFEDGGVLVASGWFSRLRKHDVVIIFHEGREKVKRVHKITGDRLFVLGDNSEYSTDSRDFGWLPTESVVAKVIWPYSS